MSAAQPKRRSENGLNMQFARLTGHLGAEVSGIDIGQDVEEAVVQAVLDGLVEHKVLFFRDQHISAGQFLNFALRFGRPEPYAIAKLGNLPEHPDYPDIAIVESTPARISRANVWHSDVTFQQEPSFGSILRCVKAPAVGGDTLWADMEAAFEGLDDATRSLISGLTAVHDWRYQIPKARENGVPESVIRDLDENLPPAEHPVVRTHPVSGRKGIYVNGAHTKCIKGMSDSESKALLARLYGLASIPEYQVRFRWAPDSIAFWDNRSTQHYAVLDYVGQYRRMERVTFVGDRPF